MIPAGAGIKGFADFFGQHQVVFPLEAGGGSKALSLLTSSGKDHIDGASLLKLS